MVITGASSGIGLATARAAAERGARVVLNARNEEALSEIERELNKSGSQAVYVAGDVSQREDVQRIADTAIERFGGFDTWVNNAGLSVWGRLEEVAEEDFRRLFDINFWGLVYGSLVAVKHLKPRGGSLINLGSVASDMSLPLQGMYCASKHAVKGFTDALRIELEEEGAPVSITLIKPTSIDTPFPQNAKNYTEREPRLPDPAYPPEEVARAVLHAAEHGGRDIYVGGAGKAMTEFYRHAPRAMDWYAETTMVGQQQRREPPRNPDGTLYRPGRGGRVRGDHPGFVMRRSAYTRAAIHPVASAAILAAAGVAAAAWLTSDLSWRR
jgi:NAD(P)-dependent dehydrogenase (short-subunit alcohol dehydrogenase family)